MIEAKFVLIATIAYQKSYIQGGLAHGTLECESLPSTEDARMLLGKVCQECNIDKDEIMGVSAIAHGIGGEMRAVEGFQPGQRHW